MRNFPEIFYADSHSYPSLVERHLAVARHYLILPNRFHQIFALAIAALFIAFVTCFIVYATVEKYHVTNNILYGHAEFSFIDQGYPEDFGYFLELFCVMLFSLHAWAHKKNNGSRGREFSW